MQEFTIKVTVATYKTTTVKVRAESGCDAEDKAEELYFADDGIPGGIRDRMETNGATLTTEVMESQPAMVHADDDVDRDPPGDHSY